jgi:peptidoglycan/xylan/chitin deacetylase (PgdA/CDA1 family)
VSNRPRHTSGSERRDASPDAQPLGPVTREEFQEFLRDDGAPADEVFGERLRRRLRSLFAFSTLKSGLASGFEATGLNGMLLRLQTGLLSPYARALNYHDVPAPLADAFEAQLRLFAKHFVNVGPAELRALHADAWPHPKPGLLLTFDDGFRSHADVVAPLLEKYGFTGWFNVPVGFVETPPEEQRAFARANRIDPCEWLGADPRIALSWRDLLRLDGRHEICCHTWNHRRLSAELGPQELQREIVDSKRRLEEGLGHEVRAFTWVGGEEWAYSRAAADAIRAAGYEIAFMTNNAVFRPHGELLQIQRTNVEASFDPRFVRFCLSGFYDSLYTAKRRRVNRLTAARAA